MSWHDLKRPYVSPLAEARQKTPHALLGVPEGATKPEAKNAYRRLVKHYHPDQADRFLRRQNEEMLKLINDAFDRLPDAANE